MKKKFAVAALSAVLAVSLLAGCGSGGGSASSKAAGSSAAASSAAASSTAAGSSAASSSVAGSSAAADGEFKKGLKGDGPTELTCRYADFKVPEGLKWEVYTYNASGTTGSVVMHMGKKSTGSLIFEVSTTRMIGAQNSPTGKNKDIETPEEAANEVFRMHGNNGKAKRTDGEKVKISKYEFQTLTIDDGFNNKTYLATAYKTSDGKAAFVEIGINNKDKDDEKLDYKDGLAKQFIESLNLK